MIQPTELRIGNYLNYYNQNCHVMGIYNYGKIELGYFEESIGFIRQLDDKGIHPIPLTEEILAKCGFEIDYHIGDDVNFTIGNIDIRKRSGMDYYVFYNKETQVRILHIHQLQNLYWCLCGKELEVNL